MTSAVGEVILVNVVKKEKVESKMCEVAEHISPCIDVHAHLTDTQFNQDIDDVIAKARQAGVTAVLVVSESAEDFQRVLDLADRHSDIVAPCLGLHPVQKTDDPNDAGFGQRSVAVKDYEEAEKILEKYCHRLAAIGEIGLDFTPRWCPTPEDKVQQREVFSRQIKLAQKFDLPVNVHSRSAGQHAINLLKECGATKVLLHAFDGRASSALSGVECGYYFSVPPSIARSPQKQKLVSAVPLSHLCLETDSPVLGPDKTTQKLVSALPLDHLVLETDSPSLSPEKGGRNEPANVTVSCEWIARLKNVSVEEVRKITTQNALSLFPALTKLVHR